MLRITKGGRGTGPAISVQGDWIVRGRRGFYGAHSAALLCQENWPHLFIIFHILEIKISTAE